MKTFLLYISTVLIFLSLSGCGNSSSNSTVPTYNVSINSNLIKDGQTYLVEVYGDDDSTESYTYCTASGTSCGTAIPQNGFTQGSVNVKLTQNRTLIAAGIIDSAYFLLPTNTTQTINLDEVSTGDYLLNTMQLIIDNTMPDTDVANDIVNKFNLSQDDDYNAPIATYMLFKQLQGSLTEDDGLYLALDYLYGVPTATNPSVSTSSQTSVTSIIKSAVSSVSGILKTGPDSAPTASLGVEEVSRRDAVDLTALTLRASSAAQTVATNAGNAANEAAAATGEKPKAPDYSRVVDDKALAAAVQALAAKLGVKALPTSAEDAQTLIMIKNFAQVGLRGFDIAVPGLGLALSSITGGLFDSMLPKIDPNQSVVDAVNRVDASVNRVNDTLKSSAQMAAQKDINNFRVQIAKVRSEISTSTAYLSSYLGNFNTQGIVKDATFVLADLIDKDLNATTSTNRANKILQLQDAFNVNDRSKNDKLIDNVKYIALPENSSSFNDAITRLANTTEANANADNSFNTSSSSNIIAIKQAAAGNAVKYLGNVFTTLEKARQYHLVAAYLKYRSQYRDNFKTMYINIPGFDSEGTYSGAVKAVNNFYIDQETAFEQAINGNADTISKSILGGDAAKYFNQDLLLKTIKKDGVDINVSQCYITYWDKNQNLGYKCKTEPGKLTDYMISTINTTCGSGSSLNAISEYASADGKNRYACKLASPQTVTTNPTGAFPANIGVSPSELNNRWVTNILNIGVYILQTDSLQNISGTVKASPNAWAVFFKSGQSGNVSGNYSVYSRNIYDSSMDTARTGVVSTTLDGQIAYGPAFALTNSSGLSSLDINDTNAPGVHNYALFVAKTSIGNTYTTIGCTTSDCSIVNVEKNYNRIRFEDGAAIAIDNKGLNRQINGVSLLTYSSLPKWVPDGDWTSKCTNATISNGTLKANCSALKNGPYTWATLNYKTCAVGASVVVDADSNNNSFLKCQ